MSNGKSSFSAGTCEKSKSKAQWKLADGISLEKSHGSVVSNVFNREN